MPRKPKPFQRVSLVLRHPAEPLRGWRDARANELNVGDIVAGYGLIIKVETHLPDTTSSAPFQVVWLKFPVGGKAYKADSLVFAFTFPATDG